MGYRCTRKGTAYVLQTETGNWNMAALEYWKGTYSCIIVRTVLVSSESKSGKTE